MKSALTILSVYIALVVAEDNQLLRGEQLDQVWVSDEATNFEYL